MDLGLTGYDELSKIYKSTSQLVRKMTENWAIKNLYCPKCGGSLNQYKDNTPVYDFYCDHPKENVMLVSLPTDKRENFQLKSTSNFPHKSFPTRILGAEYNTTMNSLMQKTFPSLIILHYERNSFNVGDVVLVHRLSITQSCIEKRIPLSQTARRKGWVGAIINLGMIPQVARIIVIEKGVIIPKKVVMERWASTTLLLEGELNQRSWVTDILNYIDRLPKTFMLSDLYRFEGELAKLHPENKHVRDKIRQQLQVIRDRGYLKFIGKGEYQKL